MLITLSGWAGTDADDEFRVNSACKANAVALGFGYPWTSVASNRRNRLDVRSMDGLGRIERTDRDVIAVEVSE
jgi:hypothetical protein